MTWAVWSVIGAYVLMGIVGAIIFLPEKMPWNKEKHGKKKD